MKALKATCVSLLIAAGSTPILAETASADIDVTAGLAPVISMTCTPVRFGVWRIPSRNAGGSTEIMLSTSSDTPTPSGNATGVALSTTAGWDAARGVCTVTGSSATEGTVIDAVLTGAVGDLSTDGASATYAGLAAPAVAATMYFEAIASLPTPLTAGSSTFYVGGSLYIHQNITSANYGAYKSVMPIMATGDDGV